LYNYKARLYDPISGVFISSDPYLSPNFAFNLIQGPKGELGQGHFSFAGDKRTQTSRTKTLVDFFTHTSQRLNRYAYVLNDPVNRVDPLGLFNILFGGGATAAAPTGGEVAGGVVINPGLFGQKADAGVFASVGPTAGVNISADVFVGYVKGGIENVKGTTMNQNISVGPISITIFHDQITGEIMGGTIGAGPGATAVGYSGAYDTTGTATIRDFLNWIAPNP
jgi:hypothetical protein